MSGRKRWIRSAVLAGLLFLLMLPAAACADTVNINENGMTGTLTNVSWKYDPSFHFNLDWSGGKKILWVIPVPTLKFGVDFRVGVETDFALNITRATLLPGQNIDGRFDENTAGMLSKDISSSFNDAIQYIPKQGFSFQMRARLKAGATRPVKTKGHIRCDAVLSLSVERGLNYTFNPEVAFTTVEPQGADAETLVCVGMQFDEDVGLGVVGYKSFKIGPLLKGNAGIFAGGMATATLHRDEWNSSDDYLQGRSQVHSCTDAGRAGCVNGAVRQTKDIYARVGVDLTIPIIKYNVYRNDWNIANEYRASGKRNYVQSLTWEEPIQFKANCDHMYYRVPVAVWYDRAKTNPAPGVEVRREGNNEIDANMLKFASGTTRYAGSQPGAGRIDLYLPYIDGRYTIDARNDAYNMSGSAQQPSNMRRDQNDQVDIVLETGNKTTYSVRKEWDIDFENKDRPGEIEVLLQAQHYDTPFYTWEGVQAVTLNAENNWSAAFDEVPRYEADEEGNIREIRYRIRELKMPPDGAGGGGNPQDQGQNPENIFPENLAEVVQQGDGLLQPDGGAMAEYSRRVVPDEYDIDNIHVWAVIKNRFENKQDLWQVGVDYIKGMAGSALFPEPYVTYKVPAYNTIVGEHVDEHETKYRVTYKMDGTEMTITNTAVWDTAVYKRWIMLGDAKTPDSVYLVLLSRVKKEYVEYFGLPANYNLWLPIFNPISGNKINLLRLAGLDILAELDYKNTLSIPLTIGEAKPSKDNPLTGWRVKFCVKKYGWMGIPGVPIDLQGQELSSAIVTDVLKFVTGLDIPISFSLNPFSGDKYITVPGRMLHIPLLDKDWELTGNVINTWYEGHGDDVRAIGGTKHWAGDREEDRPEYLVITVRDGDQTVGRAVTNKEQNWAWSLLSTDCEEGVTLDPNRQYTISEEYPENYAHKDKYSLKVDGNDLTNTWTKDKERQVRIEVVFEDPGASADPTIKLLQNGSVKWSRTVDSRDSSGTSQVYTIADHQDGLDLSGDTVDNIAKTLRVESEGGNWTVSISGPETVTADKVTYQFRAVYRIQRSGENFSVKIVKEWKDDRAEDRPDSVTVRLLRDGETVRDRITLEPSDWLKEISTADDGSDLSRLRPDGEPYRYAVTETAADGYRTGVSKTEGESGSKYIITFTVTNTKQEQVTVRGTKKWEDQDDAAHLRPRSVTVNVLAETLGSVREIEVTGPDWTFEAANLPRYDRSGQPIRYRVIESVKDEEGRDSSVPGYAVTYADPVFDEAAGTWTCDITNTAGIVNIPVTKIWDDEDDEQGLRPESVTVRLSRATDGGTEEIASRELSAANGWQAVFERMPEKDANGQQIEYTLTEDAVKNYTAKIEKTENHGFRVTNTPDGTTGNIEVIKKWEGDEGRTADRPFSITVHLYDDSREIASQVITAYSGWKGTFRGVPVRDQDGKVIHYALTEDPVSGYETKEIERSEDGQTITVTNRYNNELTVTVKKVWKDVEEIPDRVTAVLYRQAGPDAERERVRPLIEILDVNGWTATRGNLPKYDSRGTEYIYSIDEVSVRNTKSRVSGGKSDGGYAFTITNTPEFRDIRVKKIWDDGNNSRRTRPEYITIHLFADGKEVDSVRLNAPGSDQTAAETVFLHKDYYREDGTGLIQYTVTEDTVLGYQSTVSGNMTDGFIITNLSDSLEKRDIRVEKVWEDNENEFGNRPDSVTVQLYADGTVKESREITAADGWKGVFTGLDVRRADGGTIMYTVREEPPAAYEAKTTGSAAEGFVVTNTEKRRDVEIRKIWKDDNDIRGIRPESVTYRLKVNGAVKYTWNADRSTDWGVTFPSVPLYKDGKPIEFDLDEIRYRPVDRRYFAEVDGDAEKGFTVTNTLIPDKVDIQVEKTWEESEEDEELPSSVWIILQRKPANAGDTVPPYDVERAEMKPDAQGVWSYTFKDQDVYDRNGIFWDYFVREEKPAGFDDPIISEPTPYHYEIYNFREYTALIVEKIWDDRDNAAGKRPEKIAFELLKNGEATGRTLELPDPDLGWRGVFGGLRMTDNAGNPISYSARETTDVGANGYTTVYGEVRKGEFNVLTQQITNRYETVTVSGTKIWDDADNQDGKRPASVTVSLKMKGQDEPVAAVTVDEKVNWAFRFENLPMYAGSTGGTPIEYYVEEAAVAEYTTVCSEPAYDGGTKTWTCNITNTHTPEKVDVEGTKIWEDEDDQDGMRPTSIVVRLMDGEVEAASQTVTAQNNWKYSFKDLPKYKDGRLILYRVDEKPIEGYVPVPGSQVNDLVNYHITEKVNVRIRMVWDDAGDRDGLRPQSVNVALRANGGLLGSRTLTAAEGWSYTFKNLPLNEQGMVISFNVMEAEPIGYTPIYAANGYDPMTNTWEWTITNRHVPDVVEVSGEKTWDDDGDRDGLRPESITVSLMAFDAKVDEIQVRPDAEGKWSWRWAGLPRNWNHGQPFLYTVTEETVEGYSTARDGYSFTNSHKPETVDVAVRKIWEDTDDQDGKRPQSVTVYLLADGVKAGEAVLTPDDDGNWTHTFADLLRYRDHGTQIVYTVEEEQINGYTVSVTGTQESGFTLINAHLPEITDVTAYKTWDDDGNRDGRRPDDAAVQLYMQAGEDELKAVDDPVTVGTEDGWQYIWRFLPVYEKGQRIRYFVGETLPGDCGYTSNAETPVETQKGEEGPEVRIVNAYVPERTVISVTKQWDDDGNRDGLRPESVTVRVLADGEAVAERVITAADGWNWTLTDLPVNAGGEKIIYTVEEDPVAGYTCAVQGNAADGFRIVNTHTPAPGPDPDPPYSYKFSFTKRWTGGRKDSIDWTLYNPDGSVAHKRFNKTAVSEDEWYYEAWFSGDVDYSLIENVPEGYQVRYENVGAHAGETDRCYNGGTIINYRTPRTGDSADPVLWTVCIAAGSVLLAVGIFIERRRKRK